MVRWNLLRSTVQVNAAERAASLRLNKSIADLEDLERRILSDVHERLDSLRVRVQVYELARTGLRSAASAVKLARKKIEAGRGTLLELRDAELRFTQAQVSAVNARLDVEIGQEELRHALGGINPFAL